jgi:hypothetical protein
MRSIDPFWTENPGTRLLLTQQDLDVVSRLLTTTGLVLRSTVEGTGAALVREHETSGSNAWWCRLDGPRARDGWWEFGGPERHSLGLGRGFTR